MHNENLPPTMQELLGGSDVNLVLMIKEHVPPRIEAIEKEIRTLRDRTSALVAERETLTRLYAALEPPVKGEDTV